MLKGETLLPGRERRFVGYGSWRVCSRVGAIVPPDCHCWRVGRMHMPGMHVHVPDVSAGGDLHGQRGWRRESGPFRRRCALRPELRRDEFE